MAHSERCPICYGKGKVTPDSVETSNNLVVCYGCLGKGWIEVGDDPIPYYPFYPYYPYLPTTITYSSKGIS